MSTSTVRALSPSLQVVDLGSVRAAEVERFLGSETALWRERLDWDVSDAVAALARAIDRGGVTGKAVRHGSQIAGFAYYSIEGGRGILSGFLLAPELRSPSDAEGGARSLHVDVARTILRAATRDLQRRRVRRIESQFIGFDAPWLVPCFEWEGYRVHWREFLRQPISLGPAAASSSTNLALLPWRAWNLSEASVVMHQAHAGGVDARMNELYRTPEGCRSLLNNIVRQRGCGTPVNEASFVARHSRTDRALGFGLVTETATKKAHLAQLAVTPAAQRSGVGRSLVCRSAARLRDLGFDTLSLMVSSGNVGALALYRSLGFEHAFRFPVFSWERR